MRMDSAYPGEPGNNDGLETGLVGGAYGRKIGVESVYAYAGVDRHIPGFHPIPRG